jgi:hypothetical protein
MVTRERSPSRRFPSDWDQRLPKHQGAPDTGRFFSAGSLESTRPLSFNRGELVKVARAVGAPALTEVLVDWGNETAHAGEFAAGLLMNHWPLELPPRPSFGGQLKAWGSDAWGDNAKKVKTIERVKTNAANFRSPFLITRAPKLRQLEE